MRKAIKVVLIVLSPFIVVCFLVFIFLLIEFRSSVKENRYYKKANWNVSKSNFEEEIFPIINNYYEKSFINGTVSKKKIDDESYKIIVESSNYCISSFFWLFDSRFCRFDVNFNFYQNDYPIKYDQIMFFDNFITDFGRKTFYNFKINNYIVLDLYDENDYNKSEVYYFDDLVGNLGCGYNILSNNGQIKDAYSNYSYKLTFSISALFRDSETFVERLNS